MEKAKMGALKNLAVVLSLDAANFVKGVDVAQGKLKGFADTMRTVGLTSFSLPSLGLGTIGGMVGEFRRIAQEAKAAYHEAHAIGMTTQDFMSVEAAARSL